MNRIKIFSLKQSAVLKRIKKKEKKSKEKSVISPGPSMCKSMDVAETELYKSWNLNLQIRYQKITYGH